MKPRWIVCEDGDEYLSRFRRFLGAEFDFVPASHLHDVIRCAPRAGGVVLDLDFRRSEPGQLVDESGASRAEAVRTDVSNRSCPMTRARSPRASSRSFSSSMAARTPRCPQGSTAQRAVS